jgi:hypothetical protein
MIDLDDDRLAHVLASLTDLLVTDTASVTLPVRRRRPVRVVALGLAAAAVTVVSVSPLRGAVADWLGIGSTRIDIVPAPASTAQSQPSIDDDLPRIDRVDVERALGAPLPDLDTTSLGEPIAYATMPEGGIVVVWADTSTLWIHDITMHPGILFEKLLSANESVERIGGLGDDAIAVSGDHMVHTPHRSFAAGTTVLWTDGSWEYRLESDRPADELVGVARQIAGELDR